MFLCIRREDYHYIRNMALTSSQFNPQSVHIQQPLGTIGGVVLEHQLTPFPPDLMLLQMLHCYPFQKLVMETVIILKKNPARQIPISYPSPTIPGNHQDDQQEIVRVCITTNPLSTAVNLSIPNVLYKPSWDISHPYQESLHLTYTLT